MNNKSYKAIDSVVKAATVKELCEGFEKCIAAASSWFVHNDKFLECLRNSVAEQVDLYKLCTPQVILLGKAFPNVHIYTETKACLAFSSFRINQCKTTEQLKIQLLDVIDLFQKKMTKPRAEVLEVPEVLELLRSLQKKFGLLDIIARDRDLEIYILSRSHICYNSFLITHKNNITGMLLDKWMVFALSPVVDLLACNKYFVFLHEIGHIIYNCVTNGGEKVPFLFGDLAAILGLPFRNDEEKLQELFADVFAAAALHKTRYFSYNPYKHLFTEEILDMLENYFNLLNSQNFNVVCSNKTSTCLH